MRLYAIGDIHGHLGLLKRAHARIAADGGVDAQVVHLGDLVDRGPDSRGVISYLMDGQERGRDWIVVKGNHDRRMTQFLRDPRWVDPGAKETHTWLAPGVGGETTLASYGVADAMTRDLDAVHAEAVRAVPPAHARWLESLPNWHLTPLALFVHAGVRPGVDLHDQAEDDLLWIRRDFHDDPRDHGVLVVHGHTPVKQATHYGNRVNIDTGAAYGHPLTLVRLDDEGVWMLDDHGTHRLSSQPKAAI